MYEKAHVNIVNIKNDWKIQHDILSCEIDALSVF
jgi:hypothetical protein